MYDKKYDSLLCPFPLENLVLIFRLIITNYARTSDCKAIEKI